MGAAETEERLELEIAAQLEVPQYFLPKPLRVAGVVVQTIMQLIQTMECLVVLEVAQRQAVGLTLLPVALVIRQHNLHLKEIKEGILRVILAAQVVVAAAVEQEGQE